MNNEILIIDDEADIRMHMRGLLQDEGYQTKEAHHAESTFAALKANVPNLILLDIWLEGSSMDGLEILQKIVKLYPEIPVIMISGHGNIEMAVEAIKKGAYDFIQKPFKADHLLHLCKRALEISYLKQENTELKKVQSEESSLIGTSSAINNVRQVIERVSPTKSRVMISGEAGTGKGIVARMLHEHSSLPQNKYFSFNCALVSEEEFDSAFFGVEDGQGNILEEGALDKAQGGTLFLDSAGYLALPSQLKLLKLLQMGSFSRVGSKNSIIFDARIISSCGNDIENKMQQNLFKQDLYYRLNVVPIKMPALKERFDDLKDLSTYFMKELATQYGRPTLTFNDEVINIMQAYDWPGNIRQLRNNIEWLLIMAGPNISEITPDMISPELQSSRHSTSSVGKKQEQISSGVNFELMALPLRQARENFEREYLSAQIQRFGGNISKTSNFVGMERSALHRKLKSLGLSGDDVKKTETPLSVIQN